MTSGLLEGFVSTHGQGLHVMSLSARVSSRIGHVPVLTPKTREDEKEGSVGGNKSTVEGGARLSLRLSAEMIPICH